MELRHVFSASAACFALALLSSPLNASGLDTEQPLRYICSDWSPFAFVATDGQPTGFSIELLQAMLKELQLVGKVEFYPWSRAYHISLNQPNTLLLTLARSPEQEVLFKWVGPIAPRVVYLWKLKARTDIQVKDFEDVKRYMVGAVRDEAGETELINKDFVQDENFHSSSSPAKNFRLLYNNRVDFIYGPVFSTLYGLQQEGFDPSAVEKSLLLSADSSYYFAFNKDTPDETVARFNSALKTLKSNGVFDSLARKYNVDSLRPN